MMTADIAKLKALADALETAEWPDTSIGNKALILSAVQLLRLASSCIEDLTRTVAARDRRIKRLVWAMDYAREQGVKFPADDEPPIVHGDQS